MNQQFWCAFLLEMLFSCCSPLQKKGYKMPPLDGENWGSRQWSLGLWDCFRWCDHLKEPHKLKKTSMIFVADFFSVENLWKNQGIKTCIVNMGEVSQSSQRCERFSWNFMVSLWVSLCIVLRSFDMGYQKLQSQHFSGGTSHQTSTVGFSVWRRKRVENDEQIIFLHVWHLFAICWDCNYIKPLCNQTSSHFFGWHFWNCSELHVALELQAICDQVLWKCQKLKWHKTRCVRSGISTVFTEFFWGRKNTGRNLRIWVPKQTTPTRRSV